MSIPQIRYEYKELIGLSTGHHQSSLEDVLNRYGTDGWHVIFIKQCEQSRWSWDIVLERVGVKEEKKCTCHERDSSQVCSYCYDQGMRGHMQKGE